MLKALTCCLVFLTACNAENSASTDNHADTTYLIKNAAIIDGSGADRFAGDVRFDRNGIIAVGGLDVIETDEVFDASGMVLAPGFIDTHSHHDRSITEFPGATAAISQGITTIVVGNDGSSKFSLAEFQQQLRKNPPALNIATYTGHGSLRLEVMGDDYKRQASSEEIERMQALLASDLRDGSLGLSTGLEYDPGIYSNTSEVIELAKTASAHGGRYISHMRSEDREFHEAVEELILIGREADIPVQISHIKLAAVDIWGQAEQVLERLNKARAEGVDVTADIYPYTYWQSFLTVLLPDRDFNDLDEARFALEHLAPAAGLTLTVYKPNPDYVGMTIAEIASDWGKSNEETYLQLIRDAYDGYSADELAALDEPRESVIGVSMSEEDISAFVKWEHTNIGSDGAKEGHPRGHGAFPRAIRQYVRESDVLTLEDMIKKMTSLSAAHVGIGGRGLIQAGYPADLVVFKPDTISDKATIEYPDQLSDGIEGVWVNGELVWQGKAAVNTFPGKFIGRAKE